MKGNYHRKLFNPDYFGWHCYCRNSARRRRYYDKRQAKEKARIFRKNLVKKELAEYEELNS